MIPGDRHVSEIASMALDLLAGSVVFQIPHRPNARLNIRMGIHRWVRYLLLGTIYWTAFTSAARHAGWWRDPRSPTTA